MPPPPELGDGAGDIGVVEVLQEVEAERMAQADRHIGIGGEVEVDLEGIGQGPHPGQAGIQIGGCLSKDSVGDLAHGVGQHHLFGQAEAETGGPGGKLRQGLLPVGDLLHHGGVPHDGAGHQLGEQGHIQGRVQRVFLNGGVPPVYVDDIAEPLEGEKGDADGQGDLRDRDSKAQAADGPGQKTGVLEPGQQAQPGAYGKEQPRPGQPGPVPLSGQQATHIVDGDGQDHQKDQRTGPPPVKEQAGPQQDQVPQPTKPGGNEIIDQKQGGKKTQQKDKTAEYHREAPLLCEIRDQSAEIRAHHQESGRNWAVFTV